MDQSCTWIHEDLLTALKAVERNIADGRVHIARQREIIAVLAECSHDSKIDEALLANSNQTLFAHIATRARLLRELASDLVTGESPQP